MQTIQAIDPPVQNTICAWNQEFYGRVQITQGIIQEVHRAVAIQMVRSLLWRQENRGKTIKFYGEMQEVNISGTTNTGGTQKLDTPLKGIQDPSPWNPDNPLNGIQNLVLNGIWSQWLRGLTVPT